MEDTEMNIYTKEETMDEFMEMDDIGSIIKDKLRQYFDDKRKMNLSLTMPSGGRARFLRGKSCAYAQHKSAQKDVYVTIYGRKSEFLD